MKRGFSMLLALVLCLSLCACGQNEAVKQVESMIDALGEITLDRIDDICSAEAAYDALTAEEKEQVQNYSTLTAARDRYYELALVGEWCDPQVDLYDILSCYDRSDVVLNADMTGAASPGTPWEFSGTWSVKDGILQIQSGDSWTEYTVVEKDGTPAVQAYIPKDDYIALLDDAFLIVDVSEVELSDYFGLEVVDYEMKDQWGDPSGQHNICAYLTNRLYDQGWLYLSSSDDLAVEILYPEYQIHYAYKDGFTWDSTTEAGGYTVSWCPFDIWCGFSITGYDTADMTATTDLTVEQLSLGRARGSIVYINSKYVSGVAPSADGANRTLITSFDDSAYLSGGWYDDILY